MQQNVSQGQTHKKKENHVEKVKKSSDPAMIEKFHKFRQNIKMWVRSERKQYLKDIGNDVHSKSKRFWSFFSFKNKKPILDKLYYGSTAFSRYFQCIYSDRNSCIGAEDDLFTPLSLETLDLIQVSLQDVTSLLQSIFLRKSIGPDGLPNIILKKINRVKYLFDKYMLVTIINSLVFSKLLHCSSVWANTTKKNIELLQAVQNFAARIVSGTRKFDHVAPILKQL